MKKIEIDIDVNRAIENGRLAFDEAPNRILRRLLGIDAAPARPVDAARLRARRSSGAYSVQLGKVWIEANSLRELLRRALLVAERAHRGFLKELSAHASPRGRRIIAREAADLYPRSPHLAGFAERLNDNWWFDTNLGREQVAGYLRLIARMLHFEPVPTLHKRAEKTAMTDSDLGL